MQSPRAPRSGTLAWGVRGVCAIGPSPAIPSGLGHKYQCPGGWRRCRIPPLWHDHKSRPSQSKSVTSLRRLRMAGMCWCPLLVGPPAAQGPGRVHRKGRKSPHVTPASSHSQSGKVQRTPSPRLSPPTQCGTVSTWRVLG